MVAYSSGKAVRGPQGTGTLCGREDLIEAAFENASPHRFIGRSMQVAKEEIVGLLRALELFVNEDEDEETKRYSGMCQRAVDALIEIPGIDVTLENDEYDYLTPHAVIRFSNNWNGPSRDQVWNNLAHGDPAVYLHNTGHPKELAIDHLNLSDEELEIVIEQFREKLLGGAGGESTG